eukprot:5794281-Pleurochrysis_carterae.AAC.1
MRKAERLLPAFVIQVLRREAAARLVELALLKPCGDRLLLLAGICARAPLSRRVCIAPECQSVRRCTALLCAPLASRQRGCTCDAASAPARLMVSSAPLASPAVVSALPAC